MKHLNTSINTRAAWNPVKRPVAAIVIAAQLALVLQPLSALAQDKGAPAFNPAAQPQLQRMNLLGRDIEAAKAQRAKDATSPADKASDALARIEEITKDLHADLRARGLTQAPAKAAGQGTTPNEPRDSRETRAIGPDIQIEVQRNAKATQALQLQDSQRAQHQAELKTLLAQSAQSLQATRADFAATRAELEQKKLPAEILARHDAAVAQFEQRSARFSAIALSAQTTPTASGIEDLKAFFDQNPTQRKALVNPEPSKLPWSAPKPSTRLPAESKTAWFQNLYADQKVRLAQAGTASVGPLQFSIAPEPGTAPTTDDLAPTDEVQFTPAIKAKAAELGNNPVAIYNWVHNNIEYVPTWGAIQSAQDTLDKKRGNAFDTSSLLVALLRAAHIPARYQFGTIEVPAAQLQNWLGNTSKPEAAQQLLGQGGIAARGLVEAGQISKVRMEHVWVQAYVNWSPSRGNRNATASQHPNPNAQLNAWTPLDASYKQYSYTAGLDLKAAVPLDAQALLSAAQQGASVNAAQGWVQNLNQGAIQSQLAAYQSRLKTYIDSTPRGANSTVADVIGKRIIPQQSPQLLAGTLANAVVLQGNQTSAIPSALQHQFTYSLSDAYGNPVLSYTEKLSKLVGKRLTLSYIPATAADAATIASYLPKPHADGSPILPSELPSSLPGYLINLKPQINLDGQAVATGSTSLPMGTDLNSTGGFTQLFDPTQWDLTSEQSNTVGQATAIGISAGGISAEQLSQLKDRLTATQTQLQAAAASPANAASLLAKLTGEQISGDLLTATIWSWFAAAESHNRLSQNQAGMIENPGLSYGLFHAIAQPVYSWGVIRKVTFPGVNMDIGHVRLMSWSKDNNPATWVGYNKLRGQYMSALEHAIPERFFNDPAKCNNQGAAAPVAGLPDCPQGISAVKAIALAGAQGQKIYTITSEVYRNNPNIVNAQLSAHSASTRQAVQNALDAGQEVTIHERPITQSGWTGAGYTTIDPATGAGGYIIDGGSNGGWIKLAFVIILSALLIFEAGVLIASGSFIIGSILFAWEVYAFFDFVNKLENTKTADQFNTLTAATVITALVGLVPAIEFGAVIAALQYAFLILFGIFKFGII